MHALAPHPGAWKALPPPGWVNLVWSSTDLVCAWPLSCWGRHHGWQPSTTTSLPHYLTGAHQIPTEKNPYWVIFLWVTTPEKRGSTVHLTQVLKYITCHEVSPAHVILCTRDNVRVFLVRWLSNLQHKLRTFYLQHNIGIYTSYSINYYSASLII